MAKWRKERGTNYLKEMLTGQTNVNVALGALAAGSVLALPFGLAIGLIPVVGYAAGASVASLFVPGSRKFRNKVDRRKHIESREAARDHLLAEIYKRIPDGGGTYGEAYQRMLERCASWRTSKRRRFRTTTWIPSRTPRSITWACGSVALRFTSVINRCRARTSMGVSPQRMNACRR